MRSLRPILLSALLIASGCQSDHSTGLSPLDRSPDSPAEDANVLSRAPGFALFSMGTIEANGNVDVCGRVHANVSVDNGGSAFDPPDSCPGGVTISDSAYILPHWVKTQPRYYPNTTYYYVVGKPVGTDSVWICQPDPAGSLRIRSAPGVRVTKVGSIVAGAGGSALVRYATPTKIEYRFTDTARISAYFDQVAGVFARGAGDQTVIVNLGEYLDGAPARIADIRFADNPSFDSPLRSTIINTRFIGSSSVVPALVDSANWVGGTLELSTVRFLPSNGVAFIAHSLDTPGTTYISNLPSDPAILYLTGSIDQMNWNGAIFGTVVVLGNVNSLNGSGGFWFDDSYEAVLPDYLRGFWGPIVVSEDGI